MPNRGYLPLILVGAALLLFSMAAFTVRETELALKFRFGEIVRADYKPGLHFLTPFVNNVIKFDRRILTEDYPAEQFLTSEGKILRINFFVKWRISDVSRFYTSTSGGSEEVANRRLGEIIKDGIKTVIARRTIQQVVAADRSEFLGEVLEDCRQERRQPRHRAGRRAREEHRVAGRGQRVGVQPHAAGLRAPGGAAARRRFRGVGTDASRGGPPAHRDPGQRLPRGRDHQGPGRRDGGRHLCARRTARTPSSSRSTARMQAYRRSLGKQGDVLVIAPDGEFFNYLKESGR